MSENNITTSLTSAPYTNRRVFYHQEEDLVYRDSSVPISSISNYRAGQTRSSSRPISVQTRVSDPIVISSSSADSEGDNWVDDQQSTEPIPADFDPRAIFCPSPPSCSHQDAPVTRSRARAQAQPQACTILNLTESHNSADLSHGTGSSKSKTDDNRYHLRQPLIRQDPPISRNRGRACMNGLDGSVDGYTSTNREGTAGLSPEIESFTSDRDNDEYELPESENGSDYEESIINEIRGTSKKTASKKPSKANSKPKGKQRGKEKATRTIPQPATNNVVPNHATHTPNLKIGAGSSDQEAPYLIADSQDIAEDPKGLVKSSKATTSAFKTRRPKQPFYIDNLSGQAESVSNSSALSNHNAQNQSPEQHGKPSSFSLNKTEQRGDAVIQTTTRNKRTALDISQPKAKRERCSKSLKHTDEGKGRASGRTQPIVATDKANNPHNIPSSNQRLHYTDTECGETCLQNSPSHHAEETSTKPSNFELDEQLVKKTKAASLIMESLTEADVSAHACLPPLSYSPDSSSRMTETKNEATQTEMFAIKPPPPIFSPYGENTKPATSNRITGHWFLGSPQVYKTSELPLKKPITTRVRGDHERTGRPDLPSAKVFRDVTIIEESLHPNSRAWAQGIAEGSREKTSASVPPIMAEESSPSGRPVEITQEHRKNLVSKRETTLGGRRNAVFESIHEVTAVSEIDSLPLMSQY